MIYEKGSALKIRVGRYNNRTEYHLMFSQENLNYALAGCPDTQGKLLAIKDKGKGNKKSKHIEFELNLDEDGKISEEIGTASGYCIHTIYIGSKDNLEETIANFKHMPITINIRKNSDDKLITGYVTLNLEKKKLIK